MPKTLMRLGQYLLIITLFLEFGGHWLVLQSVAWGRMLVEYSRSENLIVAVEKTFDRQHPCALCKKIEKSKGEEEKNADQVVICKLELFYCASTDRILPAQDASLQRIEDHQSASQDKEPSVPPPRCA